MRRIVQFWRAASKKFAVRQCLCTNGPVSQSSRISHKIFIGNVLKIGFRFFQRPWVGISMIRCSAPSEYRVIDKQTSTNKLTIFMTLSHNSLYVQGRLKVRLKGSFDLLAKRIATVSVIFPRVLILGTCVRWDIVRTMVVCLQASVRTMVVGLQASSSLVVCCIGCSVTGLGSPRVSCNYLFRREESRHSGVRSLYSRTDAVT
jgi:hypothetical protein